LQDHMQIDEKMLAIVRRKLDLCEEPVMLMRGKHKRCFLPKMHRKI